MTQPLDKKVTISGTNANGNVVELELPATSWKVTSANNINSFQRPKQGGGEPETRALNMNRIEFPVQVTMSVTDGFAAKNHNGSGDRPNLSNKEDWLLELRKLYIAVEILDLKAVNGKTHAATSEFSGYIHNLDWTEKASQDNNAYEITLKFVDEVAMNS